jgi:thiol-disulfide isomerase/thioredoxin
MTHFTLYSRSYCHLCEDMLLALRPFQDEHGFTVEVLDVDESPDLLARYDELVPLLLGQKSTQPTQEICHYFLDTARLEAFLHG